MTVGEIIYNRRKELGFTLEEIGNAVGVSKSTVKKWENGFIANMRRDKIEKLAKVLQISPITLLGMDDDYVQTHEFVQSLVDPENASQQVIEQIEQEKELIALYKKNSNSEIENILPLPKTKKVPLVGTIACGTPTTAVENIEDYIDMSENIHADFALRCKGDSMINARIFDGDIVYIRQQPDVENGEIAAVLIDDEATLKRVFKHKDSLELRAENPTFPPLYYEGSELVTIRILGKAVAFLSEVR